MAFSNTRRRYASFDTVASIPGEVIDAFWFIIDHHLKGVFPLETIINFDLVNSGNLLSIRFLKTIVQQPSSLILATLLILNGLYTTEPLIIWDAKRS